jgi:hypothetical protein
MPGSVVVFGERETDEGTATSAARLTFSQPPRMVEMTRSWLPDRVATWAGDPERSLERLIIEVDGVVAGPAVALVSLVVPHEPTELVIVGRAIGLAWAMPGAPPHVVWMSAATARQRVAAHHREHMPAVFRSAAEFFGLDGVLWPPTQAPTSRPLLDYTQILDPGEHVAHAMPIIRQPIHEAPDAR